METHQKQKLLICIFDPTDFLQLSAFKVFILNSYFFLFWIPMEQPCLIDYPKTLQITRDNTYLSLFSHPSCKILGFSFVIKLKQNCIIPFKQVAEDNTNATVECGCCHEPGTGIREISVTLLKKCPLFYLKSFVIGAASPEGWTFVMYYIQKIFTKIKYLQKRTFLDPNFVNI